MKAVPALIALACSLAAVPVLSQSRSSGNVQQHGSAQASREETLRQHPDSNQGRFVAFGGEYGTLRAPCTQCHQLNGMGDPSGAFPRLADQSAWYLYSTLRDFASGKRQSEVMTPIARELTDGQMQDVAAFYATLQSVPYPPAARQNKEAIQDGQSIAQTGLIKSGVPACDTCHGPRGVGNPPIYPFLAGQYESYLEQQLHAFKSGTRQGDPMRIMETIAKELSAQQIKAVSAYYASLSPQRVTPGQWTTSAQRNTAPSADASQHVGATPNPQPQRGTTIVPGTITPSGIPPVDQSRP